MKILSFLLLFYLMISNALAEEITVNKLLEDGYKIKKDEIVNIYGEQGILYTLTKGDTLYLCTVRFSSLKSFSTICKKP